MNKIFGICAASALALGVPAHGTTTVSNDTTVPSVDVAVINPADIGSTGPVISITVGSTQQLNLISIIGNFPWGFTFANPVLPSPNTALASNIIGLPRAAINTPTVRCTPTLNYRVGSNRSAGSSTTTINAFTSGCDGARVDLRSALRQDQLGIVLGFANAPVIASNNWDNGSAGQGGSSSGNSANEVFRLSFAPTAAAVPEPATWLMMIVGFMSLGLMMRRQRLRSLRLYSA